MMMHNKNFYGLKYLAQLFKYKLKQSISDNIKFRTVIIVCCHSLHEDSFLLHFCTYPKCCHIAEYTCCRFLLYQMMMHNKNFYGLKYLAQLFKYKLKQSISDNIKFRTVIIVCCHPLHEDSFFSSFFTYPKCCHIAEYK
nr:MAG: hypothetical protein [Metapenaeopsis lamellata majanivirus]